MLVYAFILEFLLRLVTIRLALLAFASNTLTSLASAFTASPAPGQRSYAPVYEETRQPIRFSTYIVVVVALGVMAFVLVNVGADHQLHVDADTLIGDLRWAGWLALTYWLEGLIDRTITIDQSADATLNFGYNARDLAILAFAVLTAGAAVVARQMSGLNDSGWVVLAPLIVVRFLFDLSAALRARGSAAA